MKLPIQLRRARPRPLSRRQFYRQATRFARTALNRSYHAPSPAVKLLSNYWAPIPSAKGVDGVGEGSDETHALLVKAGFIRQSHAGLYQFLPLGLRVQEKVEQHIDNVMQSIGASKLALSTLSSEDLWRRSGRLQGDRSELFSLEDRKGSKYLLSPTHEEEITALVAFTVHSYRELPLKLYQITRKYRDEPRPRGGLLRSREFLMKDLYTFDHDTASALSTYKQVRKAYSDFFALLNLPVVSAAASSGSIGGDTSHEYHLPSPLGEDTLYQCSSCDFAANEEVLPPSSHTVDASSSDSPPSCPSCASPLKSTRAIELGHTFHLGTKYSVPLEANVTPSDSQSKQVPVEMGCHGIGVSRLIAGSAVHLSDSTGLNWPAAIAPFQVVMIPKAAETGVADAVQVGNGLVSPVAGQWFDVVVDNRPREFVWKMKDADLVGYPVIVLLGNKWKTKGLVEVQCRRKGFKDFVHPDGLHELVKSLLQGL